MAPHLFPSRPPATPIEQLICESAREGDPVAMLSDASFEVAAMVERTPWLPRGTHEELRSIALLLGVLAERLATPNPRRPA